MTLASPLLCLVAATMLPAANANSPLWSSITMGQAKEAVVRQVFVDARAIAHRLSRHAMLDDFYLQHDNPVSVRILYHGRPRRVCGIDIEGVRAAPAKEVLMAELGPPTSSGIRELLTSPGGAAALLTGGKLFQISTWHRGPTVVTFEERVRPGYFAILYRGTGPAGDAENC